MAIYQTNFAEYEVKESSVKFNDAAESSFNKLDAQVNQMKNQNVKQYKKNVKVLLLKQEQQELVMVH